MDFEIISADQVETVKRGRKANVDPALVTALKTLKAGNVLAVTGLKCDPTAGDYKKAKAKAGAHLRSAGRLAGVKVSVGWSPTGVPQVSTTKA